MEPCSYSREVGATGGFRDILKLICQQGAVQQEVGNSLPAWASRLGFAEV
jgi:hypothetical protein